MWAKREYKKEERPDFFLFFFFLPRYYSELSEGEYSILIRHRFARRRSVSYYISFLDGAAGINLFEM